jgi:hypothetical protein
LDKRAIVGVLSGLTLRAFIPAHPKNLPDIVGVMKDEAGIILSDAYRDFTKKLLPVLERSGSTSV